MNEEILKRKKATLANLVRAEEALKRAVRARKQKLAGGTPAEVQAKENAYNLAKAEADKAVTDYNKEFKKWKQEQSAPRSTRTRARTALYPNDNSPLMQLQDGVARKQGNNITGTPEEKQGNGTPKEDLDFMEYLDDQTTPRLSPQQKKELDDRVRRGLRSNKKSPHTELVGGVSRVVDEGSGGAGNPPTPSVVRDNKLDDTPIAKVLDFQTDENGRAAPAVSSSSGVPLDDADEPSDEYLEQFTKDGKIANRDGTDIIGLEHTIKRGKNRGSVISVDGEMNVRLRHPDGRVINYGDGGYLDEGKEKAEWATNLVNELIDEKMTIRRPPREDLGKRIQNIGRKTGRSIKKLMRKPANPLRKTDLYKQELAFRKNYSVSRNFPGELKGGKTTGLLYVEGDRPAVLQSVVQDRGNENMYRDFETRVGVFRGNERTMREMKYLSKEDREQLLQDDLLEVDENADYEVYTERPQRTSLREQVASKLFGREDGYASVALNERGADWNFPILPGGEFKEERGFLQTYSGTSNDYHNQTDGSLFPRQNGVPEGIPDNIGNGSFVDSTWPEGAPRPITVVRGVTRVKNYPQTVENNEIIEREGRPNVPQVSEEGEIDELPHDETPVSETDPGRYMYEQLLQDAEEKEHFIAASKSGKFVRVSIQDPKTKKWFKIPWSVVRENEGLQLALGEDLKKVFPKINETPEEQKRILEELDKYKGDVFTIGQAGAVVLSGAIVAAITAGVLDATGNFGPQDVEPDTTPANPPTNPPTPDTANPNPPTPDTGNPNPPTPDTPDSNPPTPDTPEPNPSTPVTPNPNLPIVPDDEDGDEGDDNGDVPRGGPVINDDGNPASDEPRILDPAPHDPVDVALRARFPIGGEQILKISQDKQIMQDVQFDLFSWVPEGFGNGETNKLFLLDQLHEKKIKFMDPMSMPRRDSGPLGAVFPVCSQFSETRTPDDITSFLNHKKRKLEDAFNTFTPMTLSVQSLGNDNNFLVGSKGLPSKPPNPFQQIIQTHGPMIPIKDPAGFEMDIFGKQGLKSIFNTQNNPRSYNIDPMNGVPTMDPDYSAEKIFHEGNDYMY
jgi:hypothetical protein